MSSHLDPGRRKAAADFFSRTVDGLRSVLDLLGEEHLNAVLELAADVAEAWRQDGGLLICGNGGSAADSQHIAAELVGRFLADRPGYRAQALTVNSSTFTAVGNDYGFDHIFSRQVQALGRPGDVLLVISTSGNSNNCVLAAEEARRRGMRVHGFLGCGGGRLADIVDGALVVPADLTPRIQEVHITMGHLLCQILESWMEPGNG